MACAPAQGAPRTRRPRHVFGCRSAARALQQGAVARVVVRQHHRRPGWGDAAPLAARRACAGGAD
eukprot:5545026-Alexandrium_andersonii.AAC.1